jgi:hypothetical protein
LNPKAFKDTAILFTVYEGGGYYDSGCVQPLDFVGDVTRIPPDGDIGLREGWVHRPRLL